MTDPRIDQIWAALGTVIDPEIGRPITDLDMVESVSIDDAGTAHVMVLMTIEGCPMRSNIEKMAGDAVARGVQGINAVRVGSGTMSEEQRSRLVASLREGRREIPFNRPDSLTRVLGISSGKGGVGKSTLTANLGAALHRLGYRVGILDADIHGFSIPGMYGISAQPTKVNDLLMPPEAHGVKVMSIGMFVPEGQAVVWRGPKMHRAIEQFASDVFWGDLDFLLLDLPPGTGDVAISVSQLLPGAELVVVTTPNTAASDVALRVGSLAKSTDQRIIGVIENMSWMDLPDGSRMEVFGSGGGERVAQALTETQGARVPLLGQVPLEQKVREGSDEGLPSVIGDPEAPASAAIMSIAQSLAQPRGLAGRKLRLTVT